MIRYRIKLIPNIIALLGVCILEIIAIPKKVNKIEVINILNPSFNFPASCRFMKNKTPPKMGENTIENILIILAEYIFLSMGSLNSSSNNGSLLLIYKNFGWLK